MYVSKSICRVSFENLPQDHVDVNVSNICEDTYIRYIPQLIVHYLYVANCYRDKYTCIFVTRGVPPFLTKLVFFLSLHSTI